MRGVRNLRTPSVPLGALPPEARHFAEFPYSPVTEKSRRYHLRVYADWCTENALDPWPATLPRLMRFAAERAPLVAYFTVREHVRIVSMMERKRGGPDFYAHPTMQTLLRGIKRDRPPEPVSPVRPSQLKKLLAYRPTTAAQQRTRVMILLSYAAGFRLGDHTRFRCEMVDFADNGAWIRGLSEERPLFYIGPSDEPENCPVRALRGLMRDRTAGPMYHCGRSRGPAGNATYCGTGEAFRDYGNVAGVTPLSIERIRVAGLIEQSKKIDLVRLGHFHGQHCIEDLARSLDRYVPFGGRWRAF